MATTGQLHLSAPLVTPYSLSRRQQGVRGTNARTPLPADEVLRAELIGFIRSGQNQRQIIFELTEEECLRLAERALEAARVLRDAGQR